MEENRAELMPAERLAALMDEKELTALVDALESVILTRNGYGRIGVEVRGRKVTKIEVMSTIKPGVE